MQLLPVVNLTNMQGCVMTTVVVGCMCVQITMPDETCIRRIQARGDLLPEAIFIAC